MKPGEPLEFLASRFSIETCIGAQKLFTDLSNWELLNLKPTDILDIPDRLYQEHGTRFCLRSNIPTQNAKYCLLGISNKFLSDVMKKYTIQSTGKDSLERLYTDRKPAQYMLANTRHYSWPKGAG